MKLSGIAGALLLAGMVSSARAQITATPLAATVVNFDDISLPPEQTFPLQVVTDQYVSRGVTFAGFGQNAGGLFNPDFGNPPPPWFSEPNIMYFASIFPVVTGGLAQSPETLTFYPPITSLQFDSSTLGADCELKSIVTVHAFAPGGAPLGTSVTPIPNEGITIAMTFAAPGAERVVVTSSHTCGPPGSLFDGVEVFSIDNVAFVPVAAPASKCAQSGIDAAGKKAKAVATCYSKALANGVAVDQACLDKATANFDKAFTKALGKDDCLTDTDGPTVESIVDTLATDAVQLVTNGSPGPDVCFGKKLTAIGKKAQSITKCYSKAAEKGTAVDEACAQKAASSFNASLKKCGTPTQLGPVELLIDQFGAALARSLTVPTTSTTTTTTSTTTTTTAPPLPQHLTFTTAVGTANCTLPTPDPPFSGEIDSDTVGTKLSDLGAGCLYIGGGAATIPPSQIPENASSILNSPDGTNLVASFGTGPADCTRGPAATQHCLNNPDATCTVDADCGGLSGSCAFDANCYFGPPVPVNGFPSTCVVNTFAADASGTVNTATGDSSVNITLASRVYLTFGQPTTCPQCMSGSCNWGSNQFGPCTTSNTQLTSLDCLPGPGFFLATLPVDLSPLTSGSTSKTAADGLFCPDQVHPGAFGVAPQDSDPPPPFAQAIKQTGSPSGDLTDGLPHPSTLVSSFCIPKTGNPAVDNAADLPGPGSLSLPGNAQFVASPSGAFLTD